MYKFLVFLMSLLLSLNLIAQEGAFDKMKDLTPGEEKASEEYIHQGIANKKASEMCQEGRGGYKDICTEDRYAFDGGSERTIEAMLPVVTKAYSMIGLVSGSSFNATAKGDNGGTMYKVEGQDSPVEVNDSNQVLGADGNPNGETIDPETSEKQTEEKKDYCVFIPMVGEAANIAYATTQNDKTMQNYQKAKPEAKQAASFYALSKTHKDQAKASKLQMGVWGATAGCYAAYLAMASVSGDWKIYAKLAGSTLITIFYKKKVDAHEERSKLLDQMAKELPQAGDCNPFTDTTCFCAEETSYSADRGNYNRFCVPDPLVARNQDTNDAVICADSKGKADPECGCAKNNTCIDRVLKAGAIDLGIPPTMMRDPLAGVKPLSNGLGTGDLDNVTSRNLNNAKKALGKFKPNKKINLNSDQKKFAKRLSDLGIPKAAAAMMAKRAPGSNKALPSSFTAGLGSYNDLAKDLDIDPNEIKPLRKKFQAGGTIATKRSKKSNFMNRFKKTGKKKGGVQIDESYAKKAMSEAEIIKDPGVSIFKVINNRYQVSGWKRFPEAFKIEEEKVPAEK